MTSRRIIAVVLLVLVLLAVFSESRKRSGKTQSKKESKRKENRHAGQEDVHYLHPSQPQFWYNCFLATFLACAGGFCSGMTIGLNSLSMLNLQIMHKSSDPKSKAMADRILGVVSDHHLFLTTLLLGNAIVLESLPLVIHLIMPDWAAILFSTVVVLIVAEVVPMSLSTGTHKYVIAYYGAPLVSWMMIAFWPICYPMARGLDKLLGGDHEERIYRRDFLTYINNKHKNQLDTLEIDFINSVMNHRQRTIKEFMVGHQDMFMLEENQHVTQELIDFIAQHDYTFVLVYSGSKVNIKAYIKTKEIILKFIHAQIKEPKVRLPLTEFKMRRVCTVYNDAIAIEVLEVFQKFKTRVVLVADKEKHSSRQMVTALSVVPVFEARQWVVYEPCEIVGVLSLKMTLYEMADYPTEALRLSSMRQSRGGSNQD